MATISAIVAATGLDKAIPLPLDRVGIAADILAGMFALAHRLRHSH